MPKITLTNNTSLLLDASSDDENATLNRYLKNPLSFITPGGFEAIAATKVADLASDAFPLAAVAGGDGTFAVEGSSLDIQANVSASIGLLEADDKDDFFQALQIDAGPAAAALVSFGVTGKISTGPIIADGDFSFGITHGTKVGLTSYVRAAATDTFKNAVTKAIAALTIPHDIRDLKSLPVNSISKLEAISSLKFDASVTYSIFNNPLASATISSLPSFSVNAAASATLEGIATHTADHTVMLAKVSDSVLHVSVSLARTDDFQTSLTVASGLTAEVGSKDILAFVLKQFSPNATAELVKINAGMPPAQAQRLRSDLKDAIDSTINSSLQASLKAVLDQSTNRKRLFLYEVDLSALNEESTAALQAGLTGDFTKITATQDGLPGIRKLDSALTTTSQRKHSLAINLLGIFNYQDTNTFIEKVKAGHTKDTNEIVLSDQTIKIDINDLTAEKLREVLLRGLTLTLPASAGTQDAGTPLNALYFERKAATDPLTMLVFHNFLKATGAPDAADAASLLDQKLENYGTCSLSLSLGLNPPLCKQLFLDEDEHSFDWTHYLTPALGAAAAVLQGADDEISLSRLKLFAAGQDFWNRLKDAGAVPNQLRLLRDSGLQENVSQDVTTFIWWSSAMADYSKALATGQSLEKTGKKVVEDSTQGANEPWLILTLWDLLDKPPITTLFRSSLLK